ncbi:protein of unknown function [Pedobacter terrae]|uniref:BT-3987-like N-terminal domain-containing protein n=1 Tax=Pedobacter terrae TaxID=405671 RepID=A0A1G7R668_9SPHI|nr:DUF1735 domain-containing protein [Pedobacter terrae]SDG06204.1 protein of unknown function [Pedobacter terrae]
MKKYSIILSLALLTMGLSSCLKDDLVSDQKYGMINVDAAKVAQLPSVSSAFALLLENKSTSLNFVEVSLAQSEPAAEDVVVTLSTDQTDAKVTANNSDPNNSKIAAFPSNKYTLPNGLKVTIPKGSRSGYLKLNLNQQDLSPATPYVLAFRIVSVDKPEYVISGNYNTSLVTVSAKNTWDGIYAMNAGSSVQRYSAPGVPTVGDALNGSLAANPDLTLSTVDATTVLIANLRWANGNGVAGIDNLQAVIDPATNLVTMKALGNATLKNIPGKDNKYDPATKTFTLNFDWNQTAAPRAVSLVIKYKASR